MGGPSRWRAAVPREHTGGAVRVQSGQGPQAGPAGGGECPLGPWQARRRRYAPDSPGISSGSRIPGFGRWPATMRDVPKWLRPPRKFGAASNARATHGRRNGADMRIVLPDVKRGSEHRGLGRLPAMVRDVPKMAEVAPEIRDDLECPFYSWQMGRREYAPHSSGHQAQTAKSGFWAAPHTRAAACICRLAGAMSRHRPHPAAGTGRGTR